MNTPPPTHLTQHKFLHYLGHKTIQPVDETMKFTQSKLKWKLSAPDFSRRRQSKQILAHHIPKFKQSWSWNGKRKDKRKQGPLDLHQTQPKHIVWNWRNKKNNKKKKFSFHSPADLKLPQLELFFGLSVGIGGAMNGDCEAGACHCLNSCLMERSDWWGGVCKGKEHLKFFVSYWLERFASQVWETDAFWFKPVSYTREKSADKWRFFLEMQLAAFGVSFDESENAFYVLRVSGVKRSPGLLFFFTFIFFNRKHNDQWHQRHLLFWQYLWDFCLD